MFTFDETISTVSNQINPEDEFTPLRFEELYNVLQVNESFTDDSLTEQMMYDKLIQINHKLSLKPYTYFFKRRSLRSDKLYQGPVTVDFILD